MSVGSSRHASSSTSSAAGTPETPIATVAQNLLFARLVAGEETPAGEVPPTYDAAIHAAPSVGGRGARSVSRGASRSASGSRRRRSDVSNAGTVREFRDRLVEEPDEEENVEADEDEGDGREERGRGRPSSRDVSRVR